MSAQLFCHTAEDGNLFFNKKSRFMPEKHFLFQVPSAPADIKAVTSGERSLIVSWKPPDRPNGVIEKYTVFRREVVNGK